MATGDKSGSGSDTFKDFDFSTFDGGADDELFQSFDPSQRTESGKPDDDEDPFKVFGDAPGLGGGAQDFLDDGSDFESMPMPKAGASEGSLSEEDASDGNEFGDIDVDVGSSDVGDVSFEFDDRDSSASVPVSEEDDPFGDSGAGDVADDDPFHDGEDPGEQEFLEDGQDDAHQQVGESKRGSLSRLVFPIAAAICVGVAGVSLYSFIPLLLGSDDPITVVETGPSAGVPSFPTGLPNRPGGLPLEGAGGSQQPGPSVAMPSPTAVPAAVSPAQPAPAQAMTPAPPAQQGLILPDLPALDAPVSSGPTEQANHLDSADELVGGEGREGIGAIPATPSLPAAEPAKMSEEAPHKVIAESAAPAEVDLSGIERGIADLREQFAATRRELDSINERIVKLEAAREALKASAVAEVPAQPASLPIDVLPPLKPAIIESATLNGFSRDVVWVGTKSGVVEVREGDRIPGAGEMVKLRQYGGDWILVTTEGIVTR